MFKVGGHVSAAGGIDKAVERAAGIGGNCVQVFSASPRVWKRPALDSFNVAAVAARQKELGVTPILTHSLYLINLASDNPELLEKSKKALKFDLEFDSLVQGAGVVVHVGSHQGRGWDAVKDQIVQAIHDILTHTPENSTFLVENSAGQNGKVFSDLGEIRWLMDQVQSSRLGWCFDTCHGFAAGYSLGQPQAQQTQLTALEEIDRWHLWEELVCVHVNDSRDPFASHRDRHANIGEGEIPITDLQNFLTHERIKQLPMILEVPGADNQGPDAQNIDRVKNLLTEASK